ncbi:MAG: response regulator [Candidatus Eisenbacteria bacterium]|nr:response regulator [Candidatus Eisenbacteria bacterium]
MPPEGNRQPERASWPAEARAEVDRLEGQIGKLERTRDVLMERVEHGMDAQSNNAFTMFQTAVGLEKQVRNRTRELERILQALTQTNADLELARAAAQQASQVKSEFLATMSHEIRTPMNAVLGMVSHLLDTPLDLTQREFAETIRNSGESLLALINQILDFSRIEAGRVVLASAEFDLATVVGEIGEGQRHAARSKHLAVEIEIDESIPRRVLGDAERLGQVLQNLIGNAIKFTETGTIQILARVEAPDLIRFEVKDTGPGIADETLSRLFEPFTQADGSSARHHGGIGLGLAICRRLVRGMGGEIGVDSTMGVGSRFWFTARLPCAGEYEQPPLRALCVDGVENGGLLAQLCPQVRSRRIVPTSLGQRGLLACLLEAKEENHPFSFVLIDFDTPGIDPVELISVMRAQFQHTCPPILVLSRAAGDGPREELRDAGAVDLVAWGDHQGALRSLERFFAGRLARSEDGERPNDPPRLLLAEDNPVNQRVACLTLTKLGYTVDVAANGVEALNALELVPYDLVLMDCQMPEMDGYEATREIRRREEPHRHTPIVALTANALKGDREKCLDAGMDDYLSKPFRAEQLRQMLERWIHSDPLASSREKAA